MNKKIRRLNFLLLLLVTCSIAIWLIVKALEENIIYFYSPSDIVEIDKLSKLLRVGGLVKESSIVKKDNLIFEFIITDNVNETKVFYQGILPRSISRKARSYC